MSSSPPPTEPPSVSELRKLLKETLRIRSQDGRIFVGTFMGTDQLLNILLLNTEEYRIGTEEYPNGRFVGQVMIPWKLVISAEKAGNGEKTGNHHNEASLYM
ncbi:hypothetical protein SERLADRAFT_479054 [Serpula lacrymans var. lacrymans S7.9]|uniref:Sm domain-containing protein n=1 Tax=Serpula lacrymans var. lacrymans (strain S7.9) TaxID=578457 RepID=F8PB82_SERL9|nr:uncharacterized protein SERLADRAFT_479054 [Serpula lacrymans var. lacrymans S7.9]EGO19522.1 hypothetical protein SERLADRAFT_479054 [Serpula lacrymans var. lacrymans S7.9]